MYSELPRLPPRRAPFGASGTAEEISIREIFDLLFAGRWTLLGVTLGMLVLGGALCLLLPPQFTATGVVQIDNESKTATPEQYGQLPAILSGAILESAGELEILRTRLVLDPVIARMNLEVVAYPRHFPILGSAIARMRGADAALAQMPSLFAGWGWGGEKIAVESMEVPFNLVNQELRLRATAEGYVLLGDWNEELLRGQVGVESSSQNGKLKLKLSELHASTGTEFSLTKLSHDDVIAGLLDDLSIAERGTQSGVIGITFTGGGRQFVADFVNALQASYLQQNVERHSLDAQRSLEFLERQLPDLRRQMLESQEQLAQYQQLHGAPDVASETQLLLENATTLEAKRLGLITDVDRAQQQFTAQHPVVLALRQQLDSVAREQERLRTRISALPPTQQEVLNLSRDLQAYTQLYNAMLASIQNFQVAKAGTVGNVRIVDPASPPFKRSFPKPRQILPVSGALGLLLGMIWVFVQRGMLRGVDDPSLLERRLGLPAASLIPYSRKQRRIRRLLGDSKMPPLLAMAFPDDTAIEALRSLRTSMEFLLKDVSSKVVMLCGPAPELGKTFVAANLAAVVAYSGRRVVVIDADLRRGRLHHYFGGESRVGVTELLENKCALDEALQVSGVEGLDYIARGSHAARPAELLMQPAFPALIAKLEGRYDLVLIDTPPVLAVADAVIVGRSAGVCVLVLKSSQHRMVEIEETVKRLRAADILVRGIVFNQVGARAGSYGYGGYGYSYYAYER